MNQRHVTPANGHIWEVLSDTGTEYTIKTNPEGWAAVINHPRASDPKKKTTKPHWDFARRAKGAAREQLKWVVAAEFEGKLYKVDGHTRGLMWSEGKLDAPEYVFAMVYRCEYLEDLNDLYSTFDQQSAADTMYEKVQGAYNENGLTITSKRLRSGMIVDALYIAMYGQMRTNSADRDFDVFEAVGQFADEIQLLDHINPRPDVFHTGVIAAALIGIKENTNNLAFFKALTEGAGSKKQGLMDPVESTIQYVLDMHKKRNAWVRANQVDLCERSLGAMDIFSYGENAKDYWSSDAPKYGGLQERVPSKSVD